MTDRPASVNGSPDEAQNHLPQVAPEERRRQRSQAVDALDERIAVASTRELPSLLDARRELLLQDDESEYRRAIISVLEQSAVAETKTRAGR